ncbi:hypothetical protein ACE7GA_18505 [Roseomonas sp. CCTCC AB2023176]|uniref:hypothetical protein n=1 Tax=Roseomonas sp. CCTCC AB2023176 TaxID=3342640 RepID=UPI0035D70F9E
MLTSRDAALATLSEIANDNLAERARQEATARILVAARRAAAALEGMAGEVDRVAASWDPEAVTALEFAETLPPREMDRLLGEAPRWAQARLKAARAA